MKHLLWTLTASLLMISCGDFYQFGEEPDDWDGVSMRITNAESCVMVGDSMPLGIEFSDTSKIGSPVFWMLSDPNIAILRNDTLRAHQPGVVDVMAIGGNGLLTDTCRVRVIERWEAGDFHRWHPSDMVIYADISIDGKPWDSSTMMIGAFVGGELTGLAVPREAFGIPYAELRIWAPTNQGQGKIDLRCYDRENFRLYVLRDDIEYDAYQTLGTLSNLYPIKFER